MRSSGRSSVSVRHLEPEVVDVRRRVAGPDLVRALVDHLDTHVGQVRQHLRQRQRRTGPVDLEAPLALPLLVDRAVERHGQAVLRRQALQHGDVVDRDAGVEVLLVRLRERVGVLAGELGDRAVAALGVQCGGEVVGPGPGRLDHLLLEQLGVVLTDRLALLHPDDEVDAGQHGLGHVGGVRDGLGADGVLQDLLHLQPDRGGVAVTRQVHQARQVAVVDVTPYEQLDGAALLHVQHRLHDRQQVLHRRLQQLVARVGLQYVEQALAAVAVRVEAGHPEQLQRLAPQHRHLHDALGVRRRRQQTDEPATPRPARRSRRTA